MKVDYIKKHLRWIFLFYIVFLIFSIISGFAGWRIFDDCNKQSVIMSILGLFPILSGLALSTIIPLLTVITLLWSLMSIVSKRIRKHLLKIVVLCIVSYLIVIPPFLSMMYFQGEGYQKTFDIGNGLTAELEGYMQKTGNYPENLSMLDNKYMTEPPKTDWCEEFDYTNFNSSYELRFNLFVSTYFYTPEKKKWIFRD